MKNFILFLGICLFAVSFNSCNNDDDSKTDEIIGKWRVNKLLIKADDQYEDDLLTECDKKSTIEFFENGTYKENSFEFNDNTNTCDDLGIVNGTWKNSGDFMYKILGIEVTGIKITLDFKITFESRKMIWEFSGTMDFEGEEIDIMIKIIFIDDDDDYIPDNIISKWQLNQQFTDGTENALTECEKKMTIQFFDDGIYEEKDYSDQNYSCIDLEIKKGNWKNLGNDMYEITNIDIPEIKVTFESNNTKMKIEFSETTNGAIHTEKLIFNKIT